MRLLSGIILGIILTIGAAYYHDINVAAAPAPTDQTQAAPDTGKRQIVNWDVLGALTREEMSLAQGLWDKALGK